MHAIFQTPSLPAFTVDGLQYLEQEQTYKVPLGAYVRAMTALSQGECLSLHFVGT